MHEVEGRRHVGKHLQKLCRKQRITIVDQIALPNEDAAHSIGYVPADLRHPEPIHRGGNASDLDSARREMRKKRTKNRSSPRQVHTSTVKKSVATIISQCWLSR